MQYGYPQWGHGGIQNFNAPSYPGWPSPQGFGQQVSWPSSNPWPSNVSFQPTRPPQNFQGPANPVMSGMSGQNFVGISQNSGPYYQSTPSAAVTVRQPSSSTTQNSGPINHSTPSNSRPGPAASQAAAPRRESGPSAGSGSRPSQNQQSNVKASAAIGQGPADSSKAAPRAAHVAAAAPEADNYNTGIKLQEVRIGSDKALKVMKITPGSSAELCGVINVGDRLVKIGDTDVYNSYDTARVRDLLSGARGSRIWMAFENALRAEFEVELVRNVRSIKRPSETSQSAPGPAAPAVVNKPSNAAQPQAVMRKPDAQETKPSSAPASNNRSAQAQPTSQNRSPSQGQKGVSGLSQQMGNVQIRAEPSQTKQTSTASRPSQGQSSTPNGSSRPNQGQPVSTQNRAAQGVSSNPAPQQPTQSSSQIVYGHRPVTGPFGQYNSMQYTIIGGSLAGSVVGGSHAGSVVGDSLTPSLVIGDWFGGDYV